MSHQVLVVAVVVAVMLAALFAPATAMSFEGGEAATAPAAIQSWIGGSVNDLTLPFELDGEGSCAGAGSCPT